MGVAGGPDLIQDGLVLALDASDRNSYVSGSTTWFDLSGLNNSGSLINGLTFSTGSGGSITFDGTDDYVSINSAFSLTDSQAFTFNTWIYPTTGILANNYAVIGTIKAATTHWQLSYSSDPTYNMLFAFAGTSTSVGTVSTVTSLIPLNSWGLISAWYNGGDKSDITNWKIYINGIEAALKSTGTTGASTNTTSLGYRPGSGGASANYFKGNIASTQIYNRAFSASEILQNYNATKTRFGL